MTMKPAGEASLTLADFDYDLPDTRIALHPVSPRDHSKLLVMGQGAMQDRVFQDLPELLQPGDLLVFNDTKVIPARLLGQRIRDENRVAIEALLLKRLDSSRWTAFAKPGKRLKIGDRVAFGSDIRGCAAISLTGTIASKLEEGIVEIAFDRDGADLDEAIALAGAMPLPPYILEARRRIGESESDVDSTDYQTVFARNDGAVASPTASLHFTPALIEKLTAKGIGHAFLTLHVGAGTFLPVKADAISDHKMHSEWGEISVVTAKRINETREKGGRVVAVGTTVCRLLESAADEKGLVQPFLGETEIFIRPGHHFRAVDGLITNFHLPKSTLLMLVSAFAGYVPMRSAYAHAISNGYRFYSYGDSSLLWPERA
ncbi:MAG: tRNA preQ1(34) S-adenosylmethionine ribosyltransferase-isomerase QueA [Rhabdaerophilum sp.]